MHSATLRGKDFEITVGDGVVSHAEFFADLSTRDRLGVVAPNRVEGVGATNLLLAYVTAFYDRYRAGGDDFFAYPDYFTFQYESPVADYRWLDIWPSHKDVAVGGTHVDRLHAITDRGINILLVPACEPSERVYERPQLDSARRTIDRCYLYTLDGDVADADITIRCAKEPFVPWAESVFETPALQGNREVARLGMEWTSMQGNRPMLTQSFKRISLDEALSRL